MLIMKLLSFTKKQRTSKKLMKKTHVKRFNSSGAQKTAKHTHTLRISRDLKKLVETGDPEPNHSFLEGPCWFFGRKIFRDVIIPPKFDE